MAKIIVIVGTGDSGKTTSIKKLYDKLGGTISQDTKDVGNDSAILEYNGKKIGFASMGDFKEVFRINIEILLKRGCDVIIVACRSKGATQDVILEQYKSHEVYCIWKPHTDDISIQNKINIYTQDQILKLI